MKITDLLIKKLKAPPSGQKTYYDDTMAGFGVRVSQGGSKSFVIVYGEKRRRKTLGRYPAMSLSKARIEAKKVQGAVLSVVNVGDQLPDIHFDDARDRFLADSKLRTKPKTFEEYDRLLRKHFSYNKQLAEITRQNIMAAVGKLSNKPSVEQHAFVAIRTMMNWCVRHGLLHHSPVPMMRYKTTSRTRTLDDDELCVVWQRAEEVGYPYGKIVQLLILTGQRRGEITGLRRSWIHDDLIVFPAGFTKNKREHRLPIGTLARQLIDDIQDKSDLLFPSRYSDQICFNSWSKSKRQFDEPLDLPPYTLHDLRRTYSSNLAKLGVPIHVTEKLLNHVSGSISGVTAVYNRHAYEEEMRDAVTKFESYLTNLINVANEPNGPIEVMLVK